MQTFAQARQHSHNATRRSLSAVAGFDGGLRVRVRQLLRKPAVQEAGAQSEADIQALRGGGRALAASERAFFEPRFGYDFGAVRVHTDSRAARAAHSIGARAFTLGHDLVFAPGEYRPGSDRGRRLMAHELTHVVQQAQGRKQRLQRYTIDESCRSAEEFPVETVRQGVARAIEVISAPGRPAHCLRGEGEFQQGVLAILNNTTIECDPDQDPRGEGGVFSNTISLGPRSVQDGDRVVERLASVVLHEALHNWEGRLLFPHTGIVTPCTAACFPADHGMPSSLVDVNAEHCVMPPVVRGTTLSAAARADVLRGGAGAVLGFRQNLFTALRGHLSGQLGADVGYTHLFSEQARRRYGSEVLRLNPAMFGLSYRPGVMDRRGLVFNLDTGPAVEVSERGTRLGFEFRVGAGYEFDFLYLGAGVGVVVPLSDEGQTLLDASLSLGVSF